MTRKAQIFYFALPDEMRKEEKLEWFKKIRFEDVPFKRITPDKHHNWINLAEDNEWESLLPVCSKEVKAGKSKEAIFGLFSLGVVSNRDEWVYDLDKQNLKNKIGFFYNVYEEVRKNVGGKDFNDDDLDSRVKWTRDLKKDLKKNKKISLTENDFTESLFRPFIKQSYYFNQDINEMLYKMPEIYPNNICISVKGVGMAHPFHSVATKYIPHLQFTPNGQCLPLYRYDKTGNRVENITDWGLEQFRTHYQDENIKKEAIFHYTYAVLHNPAYRQKYELNLKREFPRLPFYSDFGQWVKWGKALMDLHINYETAKKYPLKRQDLTGLKNLSGLKVKLKADKLAGMIEIDEQTTLHGIPEAAWEYKLGNRSALEWILDQYKEKKPSDPTIAEKFNTYRFADYKEYVIELLQRVCTVSVRTVEIIKQMGNE
jgi:predicted helicase